MNEIRQPNAGSLFATLEFVPADGGTRDAAIVYLHGSGERGSDLSLVKRYGLPAMLASGRASTNCIVICPQLEADAEWPPGRLRFFIDEVRTRFPRVILVGYSLGASGVCHLVGRHGQVAFAAIAIAGQGPADVQASQRGVKLVTIQGELDTWPDTRAFLASVAAAGGDVVDVRLPGLGHYISEEAIAHPAVVATLQAAGIRLTLHENP